MSAFDSVTVPCPACGREIEYQSKAGACVMETYGLSDVPLPIAAEMAEEGLACDGCRVKIGFEATAVVTVVRSPWKSGQRKGAKP